MALTAEQLAEIEKQAAITAAQINAHAGEALKQRKLQCLNIAHSTLMENKRNLPIEQRQISPAEITAFAGSLLNYIDA